MSQFLIGKRYAKAFFEIASKENSVETIQKELSITSGLFETSIELQDFFKNTKISLQQKETVLIEFLTKLNLSDLCVKFLRFLFLKKRINLIHSVCQAFIQIARESSGKIQVQIVSAASLSDSNIQQLIQFASNYFQKEVEASNLIDPSIIGGTMIRSGSIVIDGSTKGRLDRIRKSIVKG